MSDRKAYDPKTAPYHLIYVDEIDGMSIKEFPDLIELAHFMSPLSIRWRDYAIIQGEQLKGLPNLGEELADLEGLGSMQDTDSNIEVLSPDRMQNLIESTQ